MINTRQPLSAGVSAYPFQQRVEVGCNNDVLDGSILNRGLIFKQFQAWTSRCKDAFDPHVVFIFVFS